MKKTNKKKRIAKGNKLQIRKATVNTKNPEVAIDLTADLLNGKYDESNALALPSKKIHKPVQEQAPTRMLPKKKRKALEKILERKRKKEQHAELLSELAKVQVTSDELSQYISVAAIQTIGKRYFNPNFTTNGPEGEISTQQKTKQHSSISGVNRKRKGLGWKPKEEKRPRYGPNIVGFESEGSSSEEDSDEDTEEQETKDKIEEKVELILEENEEKIEQEKEEIKINALTEAKVMDDKIIPNVLIDKTVVPSIPAVFVTVNRPPHIQEQRLQLPILAEEQVIMETLKESPVLILAGETGCGKTTQMPQFLYEAGYALNGKLIGITEPRRVAAVSMCRRVAEEMSLTDGQVSYQIRFEGNVTNKTQIKFMTDGVLLKEMEKDFLLIRYSVIILDEAHERNVNTDILLGLLSRAVPLRHKIGNPLKLIIMSATMRVQDFMDNQKLFKISPPLITVRSRQYPVTIHFNKVTPVNYVAETYNKVCKIHRQLPDGGILVFLTGLQEVNNLVGKLRRTFPYHKKKSNKSNVDASEDKEKSDEEPNDPAEEEMEKTLMAMQGIKKKRKKEGDKRKTPYISLDDYKACPLDEAEGDIGNDDLEMEEVVSDEEEALQLSSDAQALWVLPLYALLTSQKQNQVFLSPPTGSRLCVVATNVAETSLTIPNIKYVVDSGKLKMKLYDQTTGVSTFNVVFTSKASADQRAGRAGRVGPGHCYRLFSSAVYSDEFPDFLKPEMQRRPADDLVLQMKAMGIQRVINFPFPSPPDEEQLKLAEQRLLLLGALNPVPRGLRMKEARKREWSRHISPLGRTMASFPVNPRLSKILALGHQHDLFPLTICLVAALSVPQVLEDRSNTTDGKGIVNKWIQMRKSWAGRGQMLMLGDAMVLLRAVCACEVMSCSPEFCAANGLRHRAIIEVRKLRIQLTNEVNAVLGMELEFDPNMPPPTDLQCKLLCQLLICGFPDQVAHRDNENDKPGSKKQRPVYRCGNLADPVYLHKDSVLYNSAPEWLIYQEIYENKHLYMRGVTAIEAEWLPIFAPSLCRFSAPLEKPPPRYDQDTGTVLCYRTVTFSNAAWQLPAVEMEYPICLDKFKWFASFLLDGLVCKKLGKYSKILLSMPATMIKSWAKLQPRTEVLLQALNKMDIDSRDKLLSVWEKDKTYLLSAYHQWLPQSLHNEVALMWPPL